MGPNHDENRRTTWIFTGFCMVFVCFRMIWTRFWREKSHQEGLLCQPRFGEFPSLYAASESKESGLALAWISSILFFFFSGIPRNFISFRVILRCFGHVFGTFCMVFSSRAPDFGCQEVEDLRLRLPLDVLCLGPLSEHLPPGRTA